MAPVNSSIAVIRVTICERYGQDSGHGNRDTTDQEHQDVVETATVVVAETGVQAEDLSNDEDTDGNKAEGTDLGKDLLQVTGGVVVLTDERGSTTEESVGTGGNDDTLSLTLLASRATLRIQSVEEHENHGTSLLTRSTGHQPSCSAARTRP